MPANVLLGLASALAWGSGDFSGGMGVRSVGGSMRGALRVVLLSHATSFVLLLIAALALSIKAPHGTVLLWGFTAGVVGCLSITAFYLALSRGQMGGAAAISGLLAAAIPATVSAWSEGNPGWMRLVGFGIAGASIWMIAGSEDTQKRDGTAIGLAIGAGAGFGLYFVALKMAGSGGPLWAMASARMGSLITCGLLMLGVYVCGNPLAVRLTRATLGWALMTALLDTSGNMLFVAATRAGRLDVAAVLASLYPAGTILLAGWVLRERPTLRQGWGMAIAAAAVLMIAQ